MPTDIESVNVFFRKSEKTGQIFGQVLGSQEELQLLIHEHGYDTLPGAESEDKTLRLPRIFPHNSWKSGQWSPMDKSIPFIPAPIIGDVWQCKLNFAVKHGVLVAIPISYVEFRGSKN
jgi:hypothetical protein